MGDKKKIILCVDDNQEVLRALRLQLRRGLQHNVRIVLASSSAEALKALESLSPGRNDALLVVSDWLMPDMRGGELIKKIAERWGPMVTIVLSGHITERASEELIAMDQVLTIMSKPWDGNQLIQLISEHFDFGTPTQIGADR